MPKLTRRSALAAAVAALAAPAIVRARSLGSDGLVTVVGAGAFGAWTAEHLRRSGMKVLLLDAWGPAHSRASSGGESRMTRASYGRDEIYTRMATESLVEWKDLSNRTELPLFHQLGVLFFFSRLESYATESFAIHRRLGLPTELLDRGEMQRRFPQIDFTGVAAGLYEPQFGALMARRAIQELVSRFTTAGGRYEQAAIIPPTDVSDKLKGIQTRDDRTIESDSFVFACGPWLPRIFPAELGRRIFPTRQEVFFFAPPEGDVSFEPGKLPGWADFNGGDIFYGFPNLEGRGFKIAHDAHGPTVDPDDGDRLPSMDGLAKVRAFLKRRFPTIAHRPLTEARVCQYENSANGDLLIDFHPRLENVLFVGAGSGHGFKHAPAVGRYAAGMLTGSKRREGRFSLKTKGEAQARDVH